MPENIDNEDTTSSSTDTTGLLNEFKKRNHIFHDSENDSLNLILNKSQAAIKRLTGTDDLSNPEVAELVLERSRYVYNDALEYFEENFRSTILGVSVENYQPKEGDSDGSNGL